MIVLKHRYLSKKFQKVVVYTHAIFYIFRRSYIFGHKGIIFYVVLSCFLSTRLCYLTHHLEGRRHTRFVSCARNICSSLNFILYYSYCYMFHE
jgi:hypothetical protein